MHLKSTVTVIRGELPCGKAHFAWKSVPGRFLSVYFRTSPLAVKAHSIVLKVPSGWRGMRLEISGRPLSLPSPRLCQCDFYLRFLNGGENPFLTLIACTMPMYANSPGKKCVGQIWKALLFGLRKCQAQILLTRLKAFKQCVHHLRYSQLSDHF